MQKNKSAGCLPVQIVKVNENFFAEAICFDFNKSLENGKYPICLKLTNITPVTKKGARPSKNNCRSVSILLVFQIFLKGYLIYNFSSSLIIY